MPKATSKESPKERATSSGETVNESNAMLSIQRTSEWIKEAQLKRRAGLSTVVVVETTDRGRMKELEDWLLNRCEKCGAATVPVLVEETGKPMRLRAVCASNQPNPHKGQPNEPDTVPACSHEQAGHVIWPEYGEEVKTNLGGEGIVTRETYRERLTILTPFNGLKTWDINENGEYELRAPPAAEEASPWGGGGTIAIADADLRAMHALAAGSQTQEPRALVRDHRTVVLVRWDFTREHEMNGAAGRLSDMILDIATDDRLLNRTKSTVFVFVPDRSHLTPAALNAASLVTPPPSTLNERIRLVVQCLEGIASLNKLERRPPVKTTTEEVQLVAESLGGLNTDQTKTAVMECLKAHNRLDLGVLTKAKAEIVTKGGKLTLQPKPDVTYALVGGYQDVKNQITQGIIEPLRHPEVVKHFGGAYRPAGGILFFGPPGTGKTLLAKATAGELAFAFAEIMNDSFRTSLYGESEKNLRQILETVKAAEPIVVFSDEVESLMPNRGNGGGGESHGTSRTLVSMLLGFLDDAKRARRSIIIGATNRIEDIDPAFLRPGRLDIIIFVGYPDEQARMSIFEVHLTKKHKVPIGDDIDYPKLAKMTEMWSGAEIEFAVRDAASIAAREIIIAGGKPTKAHVLKQRHLEEAIQKRQVDPAVRRKEEDALLTQAERFVTDKSALAAYRNRGKAPKLVVTAERAPAVTPTPAAFVPGAIEEE